MAYMFCEGMIASRWGRMSGVNGTSCTLFTLQLVLHILSIYDIRNKECLVQQALALSTIALGCAGYILINCQVIQPSESQSCQQPMLFVSESTPIILCSLLLVSDPFRTVWTM